MTNRYLLLAALVTGMGANLPAQADPPPWAPAHGRRAQEVVEVRPVVPVAPVVTVVPVMPVVQEYTYIYYPAYQVYYSPAQQMWFWMNGGSWQAGINLPLQYARYSYASGGVSVVLRSDRPYVEHAYVEQTYGRPWREKHRHEERYEREHWEKRGHHDGRN